MCLYLNKLKLKKPKALFKKRYLKKLKYKYYNFELKNFKKNYLSKTFIFIKNIDVLELKWYKFFLLRLKKISRKKQSRTFVWLVCNHVFSQKSKNSRMGKGKGKQLRYASRHNFLKPVFSFNRLSISRIKKFVFYLNKKSKKNYFFF